MTGRAVRSILVKRTNPRWVDWYGHWWVEVGDESYGWWPDRRPLGVVAALTGVPGRLNGIGVCPGGSPSRDPRHGELADHAFHPVVVDERSDDEVATVIREFAARHRGEWRWSPGRLSSNCRTFQEALLSAAGLSEPPGYGHTHGACPLLAPARRLVGRPAKPPGRPQRVYRPRLPRRSLGSSRSV